MNIQIRNLRFRSWQVSHLHQWKSKARKKVCDNPVQSFTWHKPWQPVIWSMPEPRSSFMNKCLSLKKGIQFWFADLCYWGLRDDPQKIVPVIIKAPLPHFKKHSFFSYESQGYKSTETPVQERIGLCSFKWCQPPPLLILSTLAFTNPSTMLSSFLQQVCLSSASFSTHPTLHVSSLLSLVIKFQPTFRHPQGSSHKDCYINFLSWLVRNKKLISKSYIFITLCSLPSKKKKSFLEVI